MALAFAAAPTILLFMKYEFTPLALITALFLGPNAAAAQDADPVAIWEADRTVVLDAADIDLDVFRWIARPVVVFGESPFEPQFQQQMDLLLEEIDELALRDVVVITDTAPDEISDVRRQLRPRAFMLALVGKDGQIKLRKPAPWDVRELSRSIDKMPMRQQEMRDRRETDE